MRMRAKCGAVAACLALLAPLAAAQDYPVKTVRLLTSGPGGNGDITARLLAQGLAPRLKQQVIVDNRPSGFTPGEVVSRAAPDGYTLLVLGSTHWLGSLLYKLPFDAVKDFAPITQVTSTPNILLVSPSLPVKSVAELLALAKSKPGTLNFGATGSGSSNHLAAELFKYMAGIDIVHIAYKSNPSAMADLMSGVIQISFPTAAAAGPLIRSGKVKALAVTGPESSPQFPDLPTVSAAGVPGYESESPIGILAPAKTPEAIITRLYKEAVQVIQEPAIKAKLAGLGAETIGSTPAQFAEKINAEVARMSKVIKAAGIRAD